MLKFLANAFLSVLVDKKTRQKMKKHREIKNRDKQIAAIRETVEKTMTPERQELIARAMELQRAKSQIFNDLNDEDRKQMVANMIKGMLRESDNTAPDDGEKG